MRNKLIIVLFLFAFKLYVQTFDRALFIIFDNNNCNKHKTITQDFIENFYLDATNIDLEKIFKYTYVSTKDLNQLSKDKKEYASGYITEYVNFMRKTFKEKKFSLNCYNEINFEDYKTDEYVDFFKKIDIKNDINVVFATSNEKILTFFIFDKNNKLISFFPDLWGSHFERKIVPVYLEKTLEDWLSKENSSM